MTLAYFLLITKFFEKRSQQKWKIIKHFVNSFGGDLDEEALSGL